MSRESIRLPRHAEIWLAPYIRQRIRQCMWSTRLQRVWVTVVDHYEPVGSSDSMAAAQRCVARWRDRWPQIAEDSPRDCDGNRARYTFFYPAEEYDREIVETIGEMVRTGTADAEVHLHHDGDTGVSFAQKVKEFCTRLREVHGLLRERNGQTVFGFIHGDWALDNSRPDGRCCGVNGEIALLRDLGCYADFTMPSIPSPTQGRVVNRIYWCSSDAGGKPKSFDRGTEATVGGGRQGDLLMITGPVAIRFGERLLPRVEAGEIAGYDLPTTSRVRRWFDVAPAIGGDLFIKLYTHGAQARNLDPLLNGGLEKLFRSIAREATRRGLELHWASAWQMYQAVEALVFAK